MERVAYYAGWDKLVVADRNKVVKIYDPEVCFGASDVVCDSSACVFAVSMLSDLCPSTDSLCIRGDCMIVGRRVRWSTS